MTLGTKIPEYTVAIDTAERYAYKFPKVKTERRKLAEGDYALVDNETVHAAVERKTFENLLSDFARIATLHQTLTELESLPRCAMVIEAHYGDFMNPARLKERYTPAHGYRVLAELQVMHPRMPIIFAGTRKEANLWTYAFFRATAKFLARVQTGQPELAAEAPQAWSTGRRLDQRITDALSTRPDGLSLAELSLLIADADPTRIRRVLTALTKRGRVRCKGTGRAALWLLCSEGE